MRKNSFFVKQFKNAEPEIYNELKKIHDREYFFISSLIVLTILVFTLQLFLPVGLKISLLVSAIWLILLSLSLVILPSFITALKALPESHVKKSVATFLLLNIVIFCSTIYTVYVSIPFFAGGLKLLTGEL